VDVNKLKWGSDYLISENRLTETEKEALKFLEIDFNNSFQQMRHYDTQIFDILKFMFTGYTCLSGIALGLFQFGLKEEKDFSLPIAIALTIGLFVGVFMYFLVIRNRVYFVQVARYINEQRGFYLEYKPMGFENKSRMYTSHTQPPFYNWRSSQSWFFNLVALLNSSLFGVLLYVGFNGYRCVWLIISGGIFMFLALQIALSILYLLSRENKSAEMAVFGARQEIER
jgi:hypothetical protein